MDNDLNCPRLLYYIYQKEKNYNGKDNNFAKLCIK